MPGTEINFSIAKPVGGFTVNRKIASATPPASAVPAIPRRVIRWPSGTGILAMAQPTTSATASTSHTHASAGTYIVKHWIVNSLGCNSDTAQQTVIKSITHQRFYGYQSGVETVRSFTDIGPPMRAYLPTGTGILAMAIHQRFKSNMPTYASAGAAGTTLCEGDLEQGCVKTTKPVVINPKAGGRLHCSGCLPGRYLCPVHR